MVSEAICSNIRLAAFWNYTTKSVVPCASWIAIKHSHSSYYCLTPLDLIDL